MIISAVRPGCPEGVVMRDGQVQQAGKDDKNGFFEGLQPFLTAAAASSGYPCCITRRT